MQATCVTMSWEPPRGVSSATMAGVAVIVEDLRGRVLLLLRGSTAPWMPGRWNLPGGKIEPGESAVEAARRETREETTLRVHTLSWLTSVGDLSVFHADFWTGRVRLADREHERSAWVPRAIAWTWDVVPNQRAVLRAYRRRSTAAL